MVDSRTGDQQAKLHLRSDKYIYYEDGDDHTYFSYINGRIDSAIIVDYGLDIRVDHWSGDTYGSGSGTTTISLFLDEEGKIGTGVSAPAPSITIDSNLFTRALGDMITFGADEIDRSFEESGIAISVSSLGNVLNLCSMDMLQTLRCPGYESFQLNNLLVNGNLNLDLIPPGYVLIPSDRVEQNVFRYD